VTYYRVSYWRDDETSACEVNLFDKFTRGDGVQTTRLSKFYSFVPAACASRGAHNIIISYIDHYDIILCGLQYIIILVYGQSGNYIAETADADADNNIIIMHWPNSHNYRAAARSGGATVHI